MFERVIYLNMYLEITGTVDCINLQVLGYGWAGLLRKYVVEPAHMWWPSTLVQVSLFRYVLSFILNCLFVIGFFFFGIIKILYSKADKPFPWFYLQFSCICIIGFIILACHEFSPFFSLKKQKEEFSLSCFGYCYYHNRTQNLPTSCKQAVE